MAISFRFKLSSFSCSRLHFDFASDTIASKNAVNEQGIDAAREATNVLIMHSDSYHSSVRKALLLNLKVPIRALHALLRFRENQNHNSWQCFSTQKNAESSSPSTPKEKPDRKHNTTLQHTHTKALVCHLKNRNTNSYYSAHITKSLPRFTDKAELKIPCTFLSTQEAHSTKTTTKTKEIAINCKHSAWTWRGFFSFFFLLRENTPVKAWMSVDSRQKFRQCNRHSSSAHALCPLSLSLSRSPSRTLQSTTRRESQSEEGGGIGIIMVPP